MYICTVPLRLTSTAVVVVVVTLVRRAPFNHGCYLRSRNVEFNFLLSSGERLLKHVGRLQRRAAADGGHNHFARVPAGDLLLVTPRNVRRPDRAAAGGVLVPPQRGVRRRLAAAARFKAGKSCPTIIIKLLQFGSLQL